jgi:LAGLIDADG endonuclease
VLQQETVINTSIVASSACFTKLKLDKKTKTNKKLTDEQNFDWLIGFIDAEGIFYIRNFSNRPYAFEFRIRTGLYSDDTEVLVKIQNKLGIGSITPFAFVLSPHMRRNIRTD